MEETHSLQLDRRIGKRKAGNSPRANPESNIDLPTPGSEPNCGVQPGILWACLSTLKCISHMLRSQAQSGEEDFRLALMRLSPNRYPGKLRSHHAAEVWAPVSPA